MSETECDNLVCRERKKIYETTLHDRTLYQDSLKGQLNYQQEENSKCLDTIQKYEKFIVRLKQQINKLQREKQVVNKPFRAKTLKRQFFTEGMSPAKREEKDAFGYFKKVQDENKQLKQQRSEYVQRKARYNLGKLNPKKRTMLSRVKRALGFTKTTPIPMTPTPIPTPKRGTT